MPTEARWRKILVDLDGVLNIESKWRGYFEDFPMRPGAFEFLSSLYDDGWQIVVFTARPNLEGVWKWLADNHLSSFVDQVTNVKIPAVHYIDNRAIRFRGSFLEVLVAINPHQHMPSHLAGGFYWAEGGAVFQRLADGGVLIATGDASPVILSPSEWVNAIAAMSQQGDQ